MDALKYEITDPKLALTPEAKSALEEYREFRSLIDNPTARKHIKPMQPLIFALILIAPTAIYLLIALINQFLGG